MPAPATADCSEAAPAGRWLRSGPRRVRCSVPGRRPWRGTTTWPSRSSVIGALSSSRPGRRASACSRNVTSSGPRRQDAVTASAFGTISSTRGKRPSKSMGRKKLHAARLQGDVFLEPADLDRFLIGELLALEDAERRDQQVLAPGEREAALDQQTAGRRWPRFRRSDHATGSGSRRNESNPEPPKPQRPPGPGASRRERSSCSPAPPGTCPGP